MSINNEFYDVLHEKWYEADDHPIALLRAENRIRAPWIARELESRLKKNAQVLDVGCGAGFLSNHLALAGCEVTGIDLSQSSLAVAKKYDRTQTVRYLHADAYALPFERESFDAVCAMDILEHVEDPTLLIREAARVLRPGGLFFFHTFNRNALSYLVVIKGVDWFMKNAPKNMHVYSLFITPTELSALCEKESLRIACLRGFAPKVNSKAFWKFLLTRCVPKDFQFVFTKSLLTGYCGVAKKAAD